MNLKEPKELEELEMSDEDLIRDIYSHFRPMNEEEQIALLKVLLLNYYHYITNLAEKDDLLLRGAYGECSFIINYLTYPAKELMEEGYDPRRFIIKNAVKEFDNKFFRKVDA